jgi:hypothetical protein
MPKFLEKKLKAEYGDNPHAIYGTMNKIGAMKGNKETPKGKRMEEKHEKHMKAKKYKGEAHSYDSNRPKKPVQSRYTGAAGAAY